MTRMKAKSSERHHQGIPAEQWDLPATYSADGKQMLPLRDLTDPNVSALAPSQLTPNQRAELVARRIELQAEFEVVMIGAGMIDKNRAVAEVKAQSDVGRILIEVEQRVLNNLMDQVAQERSGQGKR
ncbi:MAG: hypothetical protein L0226_10635 [Acidobacteria bacterium]|nr:hypothetical protein [Acidobacteriota bacterium]